MQDRERKARAETAKERQEAMKKLSKLQVYDQLRTMHSILKNLEDRKDEWEQNALDAVDRVLYLAEGVFARPE